MFEADQGSDLEMSGHSVQIENEDPYELLEDMACPEAKKLHRQERLSWRMLQEKWQKKRGGREDEYEDSD